MLEPIQTTEEVTEEQEIVTPASEVTEESVAPESAASEEQVETSTEQATIEQPSPEPQSAPAGYVPKDKFVASAQESILNAERVKVRDARIEQLTIQDTPTDEAMRALYPEWDQLDEYNKRVLIRQETIAMQNARTLAKQQDILDRQQLEDELDQVIENNPKLSGKEAEFKRFARNPKNRGIAAEVLAKAFLFDVEDEISQAPTPQLMTTEALPAGSGGPRGDLKPKKISLEEARAIRQTDHKRYLELVKSGQIEEDDI